MLVAVPRKRPAGGSESLFDAIGRFLAEQRLAPDPANYAFAHAVLSDPDGPLHRDVAALTDGNVRLTRAEIEALGHRVASGKAPATGVSVDTERQVEGFETLVRALRAETADFGRDLAASVAALRQTDGTAGSAAVAMVNLAQITAAMRERVDQAEARLGETTREVGELRQQLAEARTDARRDPLTGLPNRRAFEERFARGGVAHLAIADVDHFKAVNDRWGHGVGDRVLRAIGATLAKVCGELAVARLGGEEFGVLIEGADTEAARAIVEAARTEVGERRYRLRENDALVSGVTLSIGMVRVVEGEGIEQAMRRADALLYRAKSEGRDRLFCENLA